MIKWRISGNLSETFKINYGKYSILLQQQIYCQERF